jgi:hypothetical protein
MPTKRRKGEDEKSFISRCMSEIKDEFPDNAQRYAVCKSYSDKSEKMRKQEELFVLTPKKTENRGIYLTRCTKHSKIRTQFPNLKERMGYCLTSFNEYYKYWNKLEMAMIPEDTALGNCIAKEKSKGFDYKTAYRHCASKIGNKPLGAGQAIVLGQDNLLIEPVEFAEVNMDIFGFKPRYFHICPGAVELFNHIVSMQMDSETQGMVRSAAQIADNVFRIEEEAVDRDETTLEEVNQMRILVEDFKDLIHEIDEETGMVHDVSFMDGHIKVVEELMTYQMGLEGACWEGYEAIGTKIVDGREVPNCVPIKEK